jgi:hypothetical protein
MFGKHLPTRQAAPAIDVDRVTVLAVVLDDRVEQRVGESGCSLGQRHTHTCSAASVPTIFVTGTSSPLRPVR